MSLKSFQSFSKDIAPFDDAVEKKSIIILLLKRIDFLHAIHAALHRGRQVQLIRYGSIISDINKWFDRVRVGGDTPSVPNHSGWFRAWPEV